jgi:hypothetical protein
MSAREGRYDVAGEHGVVYHPWLALRMALSIGPWTRGWTSCHRAALSSNTGTAVGR